MTQTFHARPAAGLRIAMALYASVTHDSRVLREAETLARAGHTVTIYCLDGGAPAGAPFETVARSPDRSSVLPDGSSPFLHARHASLPAKVASRIRWIQGYLRNLRAWGRWAVEAAGDVDVWHAHDLTGLIAVAPLVRAPALVVYDSHEIFLDGGTAARLPRPLRLLLSATEAFLARRAFALITVNETYAEVLRRRLRPRQTVIVRNTPPRWDPPSPLPSLLRDAIGVPAPQPVVLYHGAFIRDRGIEQLANSLLTPGMERVHVALLGFGPMRGELLASADDPRFGGRLHVIDAVPPAALLSWVAGADAAVSLLQPARHDHVLSTPNKLWESLAAGVPVIVSDFPLMRQIVLDGPDGQLGATCDPTDPASIGKAILSIVDQPPEWQASLRARCLTAAHTRWNWENEGARLVALYAQIQGHTRETV